VLFGTVSETQDHVARFGNVNFASDNGTWICLRLLFAQDAIPTFREFHTFSPNRIVGQPQVPKGPGSQIHFFEDLDKTLMIDPDLRIVMALLWLRFSGVFISHPSRRVAYFFLATEIRR
jgi:hypothetical protein